MVEHYLPIDLWSQILCYLPVKSLIRFRFISKSLRSLIDDKEFARKHLTHFKKTRPESRIFVFEEKTIYTKRTVRCRKTLKVQANHGTLDMDNFPVENLNKLLGRRRIINIQKWEIAGSVDGLFMLESVRFTNSRNSNDLMLWNPSIRKVRILPPQPKTPLYGDCKTMDIGFGFDPSVLDYKFVRYVLHGDSYKALHSVLVYTVGSNSWKAMKGKACPNWHFYRVRRPKTVCFHGFLYFIANDNTSEVNVVVSYDLSNEVFSSANLPEVMRYCDLRLVNDGSSLARIDSYKWSLGGSIWLSQGFGVNITWSKVYTFEYKNSIEEFLYLNKDDEVMLIEGFVNMRSHNLKTHEKKVVMKKSHHENRLHVYPYAESLMLL